MKLLTLNIQSSAIDELELKLLTLTNYIIDNSIDFVCLQEVCQHKDAEFADDYDLQNCYVLDDIFDVQSVSVPVRKDNFALLLTRALNQRSPKYSFAFKAKALGYDIFEEGSAVISAHEIDDAAFVQLSNVNDYTYYKTRYAVGISSMGCNIFSTHMGWWDDFEEPFKFQFERLDSFSRKWAETSQLFICGDFNSPRNVAGEGYNLVTSSSWFDTYSISNKKDLGITVPGVIDGWRERGVNEPVCLDYIFSANKLPVKYSKVVFNGKCEPVISDHFGVEIEI